MPTTMKKQDDFKTGSETLALKQYIGGQWSVGSSPKEVVSVNPADTREIIARYHNSTLGDVSKAMEAAQKAFPAWKATPAPVRGRILAKVAQIAKERRDQLAALMTREEGKILSEAKGEMDKGTTLIEWFSGEGWRLNGVTAPSELPKNLLYTVRQPLGVVSIITPWNFPWAIPVWKISPALMAGNTVVFKPAPQTPALAVEIVKIFEEAGLPPGVLNLVFGDAEVGSALIDHPAVKAVSFTGSTKVGRMVQAAAGQRGIKVTCEMGGKNPVVVWKDADLKLALGGIVKGAFGSTGQRCTATSRLIVHEEIADELISMIVAEIKKIQVGNGLLPEIGMGPVVDHDQMQLSLDAINEAKKEGAKLIIGGQRLDQADWAHGCFIEPTLFDGVRPAMRLFKEEIFGPVLAVTRVNSFAQAVSCANDCEFGLTASIYTQDIALAMEFVEAIEVGMVHVNSPTIGGEAQVPFGGVKGSGAGDREMAKEGLHFFTELKTVFLDYTGQSRQSNI